uniref:Uncharacterized protein n=1 Tax=Candidatus Kentrum sp. TUN TaxID=2126343 RepID=A0A450ZW85_9GAMM|nr:MAG: hypothetical protein BECKTUN1418F_GA0071002_11333 [Candidatus Kentron sp. TUN]VFK67054.1 MAG: hypothetical protein BECKTUN1418E_GA0071001_11303 [Candidatus Kentron sp. TUN]
MNIISAFATTLASPYTLLGLLALAYFWLWVRPNQKIFLADDGPDEKANRRRARDRRIRLRWIRKHTLQEYYLRLLGWFLNAFGERITGDKKHLNASVSRDTWPVRRFGVDPFTEKSYLLCLRLALIYPVLGFFIGWASGGAGELFGVEFLPPAPEIG